MADPGLAPGCRPPPPHVARQNELAILELIHSLVETLDKYFGNVCELDLMYHFDKAHYIIDEMIMNGCIVDTNRSNVLNPLTLLDKAGGS